MKRRPASPTKKTPKSAAPQPRPDALIDPKVLQKLIDIFQSAGVTELEVERGGLRVRLRRQEGAAPPLPHEVTLQVPEPARSAAPKDIPASLPSTEGLITVTSPIVGVFYRSASPDSPSYVEEGSYVRKGQVLCIVEAMKLMNEIESEIDGRVIKILMENAKPVEYGEPLFLIEPGARPEG